MLGAAADWSVYVKTRNADRERLVLQLHAY